jgi:hypothetical protein
MSTTVSFHVRVEQELIQEIKKQAVRKKKSLNKIMIDAVNFYLKAEKERERREGFEAMGKDTEMADVGFMLPALSR